MKKKLEKFFVFEIITSEFVALNCLYQEQNTSHRALSVLGNSFEVLNITNRDFFSKK